MKRWLRRILITLAAVALTLGILYECATHVGRGWLRGEAFFDGRPSSVWRGEIERQMQMEPDELIDEFPGPGQERWWRAWARHIGVRSERIRLERLLKDEDALPVLDDLSVDHSLRVREFARILTTAKAKSFDSIHSQPEAGLFITSWAILSRDDFSEWLCCCVALRKCRQLPDAE